MMVDDVDEITAFFKDQGRGKREKGGAREQKKLPSPAFFDVFCKKEDAWGDGFTFKNARALLFTNKQFSARDDIDNEAKRAWE